MKTKLKHVLTSGAIVFGVLFFLISLFKNNLGAKEPDWKLLLEASTLRTTPWRPIHIIARLSHLEKEGNHQKSWSWNWECTEGSIQGSGPRITWQSGRSGTHDVILRVQSPWGSWQEASLRILVEHVPYYDVSQDTWIDQKPTGNSDELPFRIADVHVDKPKICRGEEALISIRAEHDQGEELWLNPVIGHESAWDVTFRPPGWPHEKVGTYAVPISLVHPETGQRFDSRVYIEVEDCVAPYELLVWKTDDPIEPEAFEFNARLFRRENWVSPSPILDQADESRQLPPQAHADHYVWDFGDGETTTTNQPLVYHKFPSEKDRAPDESSGYYLVRVEAYDQQGKLLASTQNSVKFYNTYANLKHSNNVIQLKSLLGTLAQPDGNERPIVDVKLMNLDRYETAYLDTLIYRLIPCHDNDEPREQSGHANEIFQEMSVGPRAVIRGKLRWPEWGHPKGDGPCRVDVQVTGHTRPSGMDVVASLSIELGMDENVQRISDPKRKAILKKAFDLLQHKGINHVTLEDLNQLEREGKIPKGSLQQLFL